MKPYGVPRVQELVYPDCADINRFGLKSSCSRLVGKSGDIKNSFRSASAKQRSRRVWKKLARRQGKVVL